ncbi:MAG TPA: hypothetical protein DCM07_24930, partial [Planctomycetaceae bacterium]|nr:hypothetical protein [Planctomycetaceae bacterium]
EGTREAELRLDQRPAAIAKLPSDAQAIVPHKADQSELIRRITSTDEYAVMPPPEVGEKLTDAQIAKIKAWINQGAPYSRHWSFVPPERPPLPNITQQNWPTSPIDHFILAKLEAAG